MKGHIGAFHCRYRVVRPRLPAAATVRHLEEIARHALMPALGEALDRAFGDDDAVYVIRGVHVALVHDLADRTGDASLARRWSDGLARAIVAAVSGAFGAAPVVRFDDDAHYRAQFLTDLVNGCAWQRWYYGSFAGLRGRPVPEAVREVITDETTDRREVARRLHRHGVLGRILEMLDPETREAMWRADLDPPEALLPLVEAALRIGDVAGGWTGTRPQPRDVLAAYLATQPMPGNWRDRGELTSTVAAVLRMLTIRGELHLDPPSAELPGFDWLDTPALWTGALPVRLPGAPMTARRQRLIEDLRRVVAPGLLLPGRLDSPANAMILQAALSDENPEWSGDVTASTMVEKMLAAAAHPGTGSGAQWGPLGDAIVDTLVAGAPASSGTPCAGAFLLLRAATDGRVPAVTRRHPLPETGLVLLTLAMRWAGPDASSGDRVDVALGRLAGLDHGLPLPDLRAAWAGTTGAALAGWAGGVRDGLGVPDAAEPGLPGGELGLPGVDPVVGEIAAVLLRQWARWLRGFATSSMGYLLENFVRRPGRIQTDGTGLRVELEPGPFDQVLSLAGYLDDLDVPALPGVRRIRYRIGSP